MIKTLFLTLALSAVAFAQIHVPPSASAVAKADVPARSSELTTTTLVSSTSAGFYRISCYVVLTVVATTSSTMPACVANWTDKDSNVATSAWVTNQPTGNWLGQPNGAVYMVYVKAGTTITYNTTGYASVGATAMQFALHIKAEYLGQ